MKKFMCAMLAVMFVLCSVSFASAEFKFERKISIVCPWGVGGGADSTLRPMASLLKSIVGQEVEVVNVTGGNGVVAVEYVYKQPADGYTFMLGTQSLFMQDIQGTTSMNFKDEFVPVARLVHAINVITASKKATLSNKKKRLQDIFGDGEVCYNMKAKGGDCMANTTLKSVRVNIKLDNGTDSLGNTKTVSQSLGTLSKDRYDADKALAIVDLLEPVYTKSVNSVEEVKTSTLQPS